MLKSHSPGRGGKTWCVNTTLGWIVRLGTQKNRDWVSYLPSQSAIQFRFRLCRNLDWMDRVWKRRRAEPGGLLQLSPDKTVSYYRLAVQIRDIWDSPATISPNLLSHNQSGWVHSFHLYIFMSLHLNSVSAFILMTKATYDSGSVFTLEYIWFLKRSVNYPPPPPSASPSISVAWTYPRGGVLPY